MEQLTLNPIGKINGEVFLPGSKSLSNRALLIAALANGTTKITNLLVSDDINYMLNALKSLGIQYTLSECGTECTVVGNSGFFNTNESVELYLGNAGTAMRPLCAALAASKGDYTLTGEERMKERPIGHLVDALAQLSADIDYLENKDYPPVKIKGKALTGNKVTIDGSISSQFLTAILIISPLLKKKFHYPLIFFNGYLSELVIVPFTSVCIYCLTLFNCHA